MNSMQFHPPRIEKSKELRLLGLRTRMSLEENTTQDLWRRFRPVSAAIGNRSGPEWYSVEVYPDSFFNSFDPGKIFEKWAAVAVDKDASPSPGGLEQILIEEGLYAVFSYQGSASEAHRLFRHIYDEWIPSADFELDQRPHFAVMGAGYKGEDPNSQEEFWIPIRKN